MKQSPNSFKYVGKEGVIDDGNSLYYMRARYYDPELGRFISADPIGHEGGLNLYAYAGNNPVMFVDPKGLCSEKPWWDISQYFGVTYSHSLSGVGTEISDGIEQRTLTAVDVVLQSIYTSAFYLHRRILLLKLDLV